MPENNKRLEMQAKLKKLLEKQQYEFAGENTAVKICTWTKRSLKDENTCYKETFYGIRAHRCCQMSPSVGYCPNMCVFCWRDLTLTLGKTPEDNEEWDQPENIIDNCIAAQQKLLSGFGGNEKVNPKKFKEAQEPMHFAISLTGEPTAYPYLNELISELHRRGKSTFLVTNGQFPEVIKDLEPPTQLYISVDAPNKELFNKIDRPYFRNGWERLLQSLKHMKSLKDKTRTTLRITMIKGMNMTSPEQYAELINIAEPLFIEVKAYMFVGSSRLRLEMENMPRHHEVKEFAELIASEAGYQIIDDKSESRVVLLMKEDFPDRIMKFED